MNSNINKAFETVKLFVAPVFAAFAIWGVHIPDRFTPEVIIALISLFGGLVGGSAISRLRRFFRSKTF